MNHIAIDWGAKESQICTRSADGNILHEERIKTAELARYLQGQPSSRVIVESGCQSFALADVCLAVGHEVRVVPSGLVRTLGVGARGLKSDRRDAQVLSEVSTRIDLPSVYIPSARARSVRQLLVSRASLVRARTQLINCARGLLRCQGIAIRSGAAETFPQRLHKQVSAPLPDTLSRLSCALTELNVQLRDADAQLNHLAKADEVCPRLQSVPGIGPVTSLGFVSRIDEIVRFAGAHQVESYLGLVPGEHSSGQKQRRTGIHKAGDPFMRSLMVQAAWSAWIHYPHDPMVQWAKRLAERRNRYVAISALSRKMVGILYALWRDGSTYNPSRTAERIDADGVVHPVFVPNRNVPMS